MSAVPAYISGGSNVDAQRNLRLAARALKESFPGARFSHCYQNAAVGYSGPDFVNFAALLPTTLDLAGLSAELKRIEALCGRRPGAPRWEPRTMDLDILLYAEAVGEFDGVTLPRPSLLAWGFMLGPLAEIAPGLRHPVNGLTMAELWARFDRTANPLTLVDLDLAAA